MKAVAFQAGVMDEREGIVWRHEPNGDMGQGWWLDGQRILEVGVVGPQYIQTGLKALLERRKKLSSAVLQRLATYELPETRWASLIAVEGLQGVFCLRRAPGTEAHLLYHPLVRDEALLLTLRGNRPRIFEKEIVPNVYHAIEHYRASRR